MRSIFLIILYIYTFPLIANTTENQARQWIQNALFTSATIDALIELAKRGEDDVNSQAHRTMQVDSNVQGLGLANSDLLITLSASVRNLSSSYEHSRHIDAINGDLIIAIMADRLSADPYLKHLAKIDFRGAGIYPVLEPSRSGMKYNLVCDANGRCEKVSRIIVGNDHIDGWGIEGSQRKPDNQIRDFYHEAAMLGVNAFDTAPIYVEDAEFRLGKILTELNTEDYLDFDAWFPITKGGFPHDIGPGTYRSRLNTSTNAMTLDLSEEAKSSYNRLNGNIGAFFLHRDDFDSDRYIVGQKERPKVEDILQSLANEDVHNLYRWLGVSNWSNDRVNHAADLIQTQYPFFGPLLNSPYFSLMEMSDTSIHVGGVQVTHEDMMNPDFQPGVAIMPYSPLGGNNMIEPGWKSAKAKAKAWSDEQPNKRGRYWGNVYESIFHPANEARYIRGDKFLTEFNKKHRTNYTRDQLWNAYVLAHPRVDFLIVGPTNIDQLRRTVAALDLAENLTQSDLEYLYSGHLANDRTSTADKCSQVWSDL